MNEITEEEIEEIWKNGDPDEDEQIRLNGKYVWETARRVCDFINAHKDYIKISTFGEYQVVTMKVSKVIKEANNRAEKEADGKKEKD